MWPNMQHILVFFKSKITFFLLLSARPWLRFGETLSNLPGENKNTKAFSGKEINIYEKFL